MCARAGYNGLLRKKRLWSKKLGITKAHGKDIKTFDGICVKKNWSLPFLPCPGNPRSPPALCNTYTSSPTPRKRSLVRTQNESRHARLVCWKKGATQFMKSYDSAIAYWNEAKKRVRMKSSEGNFRSFVVARVSHLKCVPTANSIGTMDSLLRIANDNANFFPVWQA